MARTISPLQHTILRLAWRGHEDRIRGEESEPHRSPAYLVVDVPSRAVLQALAGEHPSRSRRVSISRAITRLENRGLVTRHYGYPESGLRITLAGVDELLRRETVDYASAMRVRAHAREG